MISAPTLMSANSAMRADQTASAGIRMVDIPAPVPQDSPVIPKSLASMSTNAHLVVMMDHPSAVVALYVTIWPDLTDVSAQLDSRATPMSLAKVCIINGLQSVYPIRPKFFSESGYNQP